MPVSVTVLPPAATAALALAETLGVSAVRRVIACVASRRPRPQLSVPTSNTQQYVSTGKLRVDDLRMDSTPSGVRLGMVEISSAAAPEVCAADALVPAEPNDSGRPFVTGST